MSSDQYVQVPANSTGVKLRTRRATVGLNDVDSEVMVLEDGNGNLLIPMSEAGTCKVSAGTIGVSMGTLQTLTQVGTLPTLGTMGTLYHVDSIRLLGTLSGLVGGTVGISQGSLNYVEALKTVGTVLGLVNGTVQVGMGTFIPAGHGTVKISDGTLTTLGTAYLAGQGTVKVSDGTLTTVTRIGTLPNVIVGSGTLQAVSAAYLAGAGTLQTVTQVGTLPTLGTMGTLYYANNVGTLYYVDTVKQVGTAYLGGAGTVKISDGTVTLRNGTLLTLNSGSLQYVGNIGTLPNIILASGTLQSAGTCYGLTQGTLNSVGSASVYSKHDLHDYHAVGTVISTSGGTIAQTASKIIKVHHYRAQTDGSYAFEFTDTKPAGGTVDAGWYFTQREGVVAPFTPYPAYLFKTTTAGSGLVVGTWPSSVCSGTLKLSLIYTDDDTS